MRAYYCLEDKFHDLLENLLSFLKNNYKKNHFTIHRFIFDHFSDSRDLFYAHIFVIMMMITMIISKEEGFKNIMNTEEYKELSNFLLALNNFVKIFT